MYYLKYVGSNDDIKTQHLDMLFLNCVDINASTYCVCDHKYFIYNTYI